MKNENMPNRKMPNKHQQKQRSFHSQMLQRKVRLHTTNTTRKHRPMEHRRTIQAPSRQLSKMRQHPISYTTRTQKTKRARANNTNNSAGNFYKTTKKALSATNHPKSQSNRSKQLMKHPFKNYLTNRNLEQKIAEYLGIYNLSIPEIRALIHWYILKPLRN
jgi:hypothetical protein